MMQERRRVTAVTGAMISSLAHTGAKAEFDKEKTSLATSLSGEAVQQRVFNLPNQPIIISLAANEHKLEVPSLGKTDLRTPQLLAVHTSSS